MAVVAPAFIKVKQNYKDKKEVLISISELAVAQGLLQAETILPELEARESEYSTAIGHGFAIPHAKSDKIQQPALLVLKAEAPVDWGGEMVDVFIALLTPGGGGQHLKLLASVSRKLMHEKFRVAVKEANSAEVLYQLFKKVEEDLND